MKTSVTLKLDTDLLREARILGACPQNAADAAWTSDRLSFLLPANPAHNG